MTKTIHPAEIRKAIVATAAAVSAWGIAALDDGSVTGPEWFGLLGVVAAALGTYAVVNAPRPVEAGDP